MTVFEPSLHASTAQASASTNSSANTEPAYHAHGQHILADLHGIAHDTLSNSKLLANLLQRAAIASGAHILFQHFHSFGPQQGVTGVLLLAESHISIHTWPENGFAAVDIFMCGKAEPILALRLINSALKPQSQQIHTQQRGAALV